MGVCEACKAPTKAGTSFCPNCGVAVNDPDGPQGYDTPSSLTPSTPRRSTPTRSAMLAVLVTALLAGVVILALRFEPMGLRLSAAGGGEAEETPESVIASAVNRVLTTDPVLARRPTSLLDLSNISELENGQFSAVAKIGLDSSASRDFPIFWDSVSETISWGHRADEPESTETNLSDISTSPAGTSVALLTGDAGLVDQIPRIHIGRDGLLDVPALGLREIATGRQPVAVDYRREWLVAVHPAAMFATFVDLSTRLVERGVVAVLFNPPIERITPDLLDLEVDCFDQKTPEPVRVICMTRELRSRYFTRVIPGEGQPNDGSLRLGRDQLRFPPDKQARLITVSQSGELALDGGPISLPGLRASLNSFRPDIEGIILCFDEQLPYARAYPVIADLVELSGQNQGLNLWLSPSTSLQCRKSPEATTEKAFHRNPEPWGERSETRQPEQIFQPSVVIPPSLKSSPRSLAGALNSCYPSASRRLNEEGRVVVVVTIGTNGKMVGLQVSQSSGYSRLDEAAECVLRKLTFNPGTRDGQAVEAQATMPVTFWLE